MHIELPRRLVILKSVAVLTLNIRQSTVLEERGRPVKQVKMEGASNCGCLSSGNCTCDTCKCATATATKETPSGQTKCAPTAKETPSGQTSGEVHGYCSCGETCKCNPCSCSRVNVAVVGKSYCKCGANCQCDKCECPTADVPNPVLAVA